MTDGTRCIVLVPDVDAAAPTAMEADHGACMDLDEPHCQV